MSSVLPEITEETDSKDEEKLQPPSMYKVILHNDDYTTMEFVVEILMDVFNKDLCEYKALVNAYKCEITEKSHFLFVNRNKIRKLGINNCPACQYHNTTLQSCDKYWSIIFL